VGEQGHPGRPSQQSRLVGEDVWTWERLCSSGYIELIDKDEEDNILLASYPSDVYQKADEYLKTIRSIVDPAHTLPSSGGSVESKFPTHCEIHPSMMYGIGASLIPFPDHNQSPRNCYQSNMSKQFIGVPFTNFRNMLSGKFHVLEYLQIPLTLSRAGAMIGYNNLPTGQNAMIAIMPAPYNEEDSLMMSRDAKERGFMASTLVVNHFVECHSQERFMKPVNPDITKGDFSKLGDDGIVPKGTCVKSGDVLICKIATDPQNASQHELFVTVYKDTFPAVVDKIVYGKTVEGFNFIRMMVVQRREPVIGDKFAARHSQKGTIGMIAPQIDLPFSERDGTSPDIVVNALAFPSRMTIAMLIELMTGRVAITKTQQYPSVLDVATVEDLDGVLKGATLNLEKEIETKFNKCLYDDMFGTAAQVDATAFRSFDLGVLIKELERCGITDMCSDRMYNGITGKLMNALVFRGPVYYGRMKHMVQDKMHARQRGGKSSITHQPLEGRRSGGGMRNGVQERDNFLGVGAPHVAQDRLFKQSDDHTLWVCDFCGLQASVKFVNGQLLEKRCNVCSTNQVSKVSIPFGTNLVFNELAGMGIFPRIITRGNSRALP
jgi:DNA-directed RNA polymerase II subunit RPB2